MGMTRDEVISRTATDYNFAMEFSVDNNLAGVLTALSYYGYTGGNSREWALTTLKTLFMTGQKDTVKKVFDMVPYLDSTPNYTGGLSDYFLRNTEPSKYPLNDPNSRLNFNGLLSALGMGLSTYAAATSPAISNANALYQQQLEEEERRKKEEAERNKKTTTIIIVVVSSLALIITLALVFRPKKNKTSN